MTCARLLSLTNTFIASTPPSQAPDHNHKSARRFRRAWGGMKHLLTYFSIQELSGFQLVFILPSFWGWRTVMFSLLGCYCTATNEVRSLHAKSARAAGLMRVGHCNSCFCLQSPRSLRSRILNPGATAVEYVRKKIPSKDTRLRII